MKNVLIIILFFLLCSSILIGQNKNSTIVANDTTKKDTAAVNPAITTDSSTTIMLRKKTRLKQPTMPRMQISEEQKKLSFEIHEKPFHDPNEATNWDAINMPTKRIDYEITKEYLPPLIPITPLEVPPKNIYDPLSIQDYTIPTRQELDILEVLWLKEDVMDTTLYSCLDTTLTITMEDLNHLLKKMTQKKIVSRKQVSPRHEFNAFGIMIEMSPTNRRNKVYSYHSNVDRELMKRFINANAYLFKEDSSIVNQKQLRAARKDSDLLKDLNTKIHTPK